MEILLRLWSEQQGQDLIEYSLLLAFLAVLSLAFIWGAQSSIDSIWTVNTNNLHAADNFASGT